MKNELHTKKPVPVSIIVATKNRPEKLQRCLHSLINTRYPNKEILVVDQSSGPSSIEMVTGMNNSDIRYYHLKSSGLSSARMFGVMKSKHSILCFTDDDCKVHVAWINEIVRSFASNPEISALFGPVFPLHDNKQATLRYFGLKTIKKTRLISALPRSWNLTLTGNNFAVRKNDLLSVGGFESWLGVGSPGMAADDDSIIYKLLLNKKKILLHPKIIVYHSHAMPRINYDLLAARYGAGFFALFTFHMLQKNYRAHSYIRTFISRHTNAWMVKTNSALRSLSWKYFSYLCFIVIYESIFYLYGSILGICVYFCKNKQNDQSHFRE